jgi:anaerobic magnesium-protoporphyrin IX monomethyl ester cyclase
MKPKPKNVFRDPLARVIPDGLRISAAEMATRHRDVFRIVNEPDHLIWRKLSDVVAEHGPKVVGISYLTPMDGLVKKVARLVKNINPEIKVVVGSYHPTFCADDVMRNSDIDFAVVGEGEVPFLKLIKEMREDSPKWEKVPSLYFRDREGRTRSTPAAPRIEDLDDLPFPARDLVLYCDYDFYRVHSVITARGCPYKCSFCSDQWFYTGKMRRRSVENVLRELTFLKETYHKLDYVDFVDGIWKNCARCLLNVN